MKPRNVAKTNQYFSNPAFFYHSIAKLILILKSYKIDSLVGSFYLEQESPVF